MKLIRDRLPNIETMRTRPAKDSEVYDLFRKKLDEEYGEYLDAHAAGLYDTQQTAEELADLLEAVQSFIRREGYSVSDIRGIASRKRAERGDFDKAVVWLQDSEE